MANWLYAAGLATAVLLAACTGDVQEAIEQGMAEGQALYEAGEFSKAGAEWRKVLRLAQRPSRPDPDSEAAALSGLGRVELAIGSAIIAERFFEQALAAMESRGRKSTLEYGEAQGGLAEAYERQGRNRDAIVLARDAVATLGADDGAALAHARQLLARLLRGSADFINNPAVQREAALLYSQVLTYQRQVLGEDSPDILPYVREVHSFLLDLRDSPEVQDIRAEAEQILQRAAARAKQRGK